ncbi:Uncharacterised protein [uncultured archaeon]|nr:Uncharacterised protein [uncultured archaeon]
MESFRRWHASHPIAHFEGMLKESGKLFLVGRRYDLEPLEPYRKTVDFGGGKLTVYDTKVRVTASERQQKAIVELVDG